MIDRRHFLAGSAAGALLLGVSPRLAVASTATDRRFVFVLQRGAADGLATLAPVGDPNFAGLRGALAEDHAGAARLDAMFALHPSLGETGRLYRSGQALFVHAVASAYRERSHFDGQNMLETGAGAPYALRDGWVNRLLAFLPVPRALALAPTVPLILRGPHQVSSYAPSRLPEATDDLLRRVASLYGQDAQLHALWEQAMQTRALAGGDTQGAVQGGAEMGTLAARLMAGDEGARVAVIETDGWDTHANQSGRLAFQLRGLDALVAALAAGLGEEWPRTLVIVATEFGRTAAPNGTGGTDHGTASVAMLLGGAVAGGRVLGDWPGLRAADLHDGRDLRPTGSLEALIAAAVAEHFRLDAARLADALFPDAPAARTWQGVIRS